MPQDTPRAATPDPAVPAHPDVAAALRASDDGMPEPPGGAAQPALTTAQGPDGRWRWDLAYADGGLSGRDHPSEEAATAHAWATWAEVAARLAPPAPQEPRAPAPVKVLKLAPAPPAEE